MKQSRRNFLTKSALSLGSAGLLSAPALGAIRPTDAGHLNKFQWQEKRLPREVWIATLTQHYLRGRTVEEVIANTVKTMETIVGFAPDIISLPEAFHVSGLPRSLPPSAETSEPSHGIGHLTAPLADFARRHKCYIIAPIYVSENGKYYNASVLIDRNGRRVGDYRKTRPTMDEILETNVTPGPMEVPVFKTDFGTIGLQICFDIEWRDGWEQLQKKGAEMVFWGSAFPGGNKINTMAWLNCYPVISSTRKGISKICDITGNAVAESGQYNQWGVCAPINLEKALVWAWPNANRFRDIHAKYGTAIHTYTLHEEELSVIESRHPELKVADILKEFDILTYADFKHQSESEQEKFW